MRAHLDDLMTGSDGYWSTDNTEGFTANDLVRLNTAQAALQDCLPEVDPRNIADMINNAWPFLDGLEVYPAPVVDT